MCTIAARARADIVSIQTQALPKTMNTVKRSVATDHPTTSAARMQKTDDRRHGMAPATTLCLAVTGLHCQDRIDATPIYQGDIALHRF